jgi:hypothetical protein
MRRRFFFFAKIASASSLKRGAMMTSVKISLIVFASAASSVRLTMMMPPNGA